MPSKIQGDFSSTQARQTVTSLDTVARVATTDKGRTIAYDYCVLATGSDATLASYADLSIPGVFVYRNIADVDKLLAHADKKDMKDASVRRWYWNLLRY